MNKKEKEEIIQLNQGRVVSLKNQKEQEPKIQLKQEKVENIKNQKEQEPKIQLKSERVESIKIEELSIEEKFEELKEYDKKLTDFASSLQIAAKELQQKGNNIENVKSCALEEIILSSNFKLIPGNNPIKQEQIDVITFDFNEILEKVKKEKAELEKEKAKFQKEKEEFFKAYKNEFQKFQEKKADEIKEDKKEENENDIPKNETKEDLINDKKEKEQVEISKEGKYGG